jgi:general secretion pathway protein A
LIDLFPLPGELKSQVEGRNRSGSNRSVTLQIRDAAAKDRPLGDSEKRASYERFYGLDERPFALSADPRFAYHSEAFDHAAQAMLDAIRRRDGVVMLTGELGIGKTVLCRAVMEQLDRRTLTSIVADPFASPEDLLRTVLVDFGVISPADRSTRPRAKASLADLSAALRGFLHSLSALEAFAVVIVDDAHNLSLEQLRHIGTVAEIGGDEHLLQLMLVGRPRLAANVLKRGMRPLFDRVSTHATLGRLGEYEIGGYVTHRLQIAGSSVRASFDSEAIDQLFAVSRGVPRVVNALCDRALARGAEKSSRTIGGRLIRSAAADLTLTLRSKALAAFRAIATAGGIALLVLWA